jgi:hypothetical protein
MGYPAVSADPGPAGPVNAEAQNGGLWQAILLVERPMEVSMGIEDKQAATLDCHDEQAIWQSLAGPDRVISKNRVRSRALFVEK